MPTSEHLSMSLEMPCAAFLVQDQLVKQQWLVTAEGHILSHLHEGPWVG